MPERFRRHILLRRFGKSLGEGKLGRGEACFTNGVRQRFGLHAPEIVTAHTDNHVKPSLMW